MVIFAQDHFLFKVFNMFKVYKPVIISMVLMTANVFSAENNPLSGNPQNPNNTDLQHLPNQNQEVNLMPPPAPRKAPALPRRNLLAIQNQNIPQIQNIGNPNNILNLVNINRNQNVIRGRDILQRQNPFHGSPVRRRLNFNEPLFFNNYEDTSDEMEN